MVTLGKHAAEIVDRCPVCDVEGVFVLSAPTLPDKIIVSVYSCPNCNCTYNSPAMTKKVMAEFYSSGAYFEHVSVVRDGRGSFGERRRSLRLMVLLMNLTNVKLPERVLDVGCSQGHLLERIKDWSYEVETVGYDIYIDPNAIREVVNEKSEITGEFDLITCIHTLEHMYDPMGELEWMNSLLVDDGILLLEVPVARYIMLEHPITFSLESIPLLMEHIGIGNYTTISAPSLESCIVLAKK